jgi:hypothetical protein
MADMLGLSPMATRSAATLEEITATVPAAARQGIFAGLDSLPRMVAKKLSIAESVAA